MTSEFDGLIYAAATAHDVPPALLRACVEQESGGNPRAVRVEKHLRDESRGLLQLLTSTAAELGVAADDLFDPAANLDAGARYLRQQFDRFPEIPDDEERWQFAVGAYNAGRGNINRALAQARYRVHGSTRLEGALPGPWQRWDFTVSFLPEASRSAGHHVERVWHFYRVNLGADLPRAEAA